MLLLVQLLLCFLGFLIHYYPFRETVVVVVGRTSSVLFGFLIHYYPFRETVVVVVVVVVAVVVVTAADADALVVDLVATFVFPF